MKLFLLFAFTAVALCGPRQKRFTVGTIQLSSPASAGSVGCVVTGNVLYANGFKLRELNSTEQEQLTSYQKEVDEYKDSIRKLVEEKQKAMEERVKSGKRTSSVGTVSQEDLPKPPKKPEFCSAEDTTQYIFDGCMVQSNKVYVGREFARDLNVEEIEQLKEFDVKQTAYQKYAKAQVEKQVKGLFGSSNFFSSLFGEQQQQEATEAPTTRSSSDVAEPAPEAPVVPKFCTAIF